VEKYDENLLEKDRKRQRTGWKCQDKVGYIQIKKQNDF
jgi:hypothetical protein